MVAGQITMLTLLHERTYSLTLTILLIGIGAAVAFPQTFPTFGNWSQLLLNLSIDTIVAVGMMLLLVAGVFDLSVGSVVAFAGGLAAYVMITFGCPLRLLFPNVGMCGIDWTDQWLSDCVSGSQSNDSNAGYDGHCAGWCPVGERIRHPEFTVLV
jgi:ABC-type glucose/galactose transport system permease subunit